MPYVPCAKRKIIILLCMNGHFRVGIDADIMFISYRPSIDIDFIRRELAFETTQDLHKFLEKLKISGTLDDQSLDARHALPGLNDLAKQFAKVDINRSATV
jgi:hypothetical protein